MLDSSTVKGRLETNTVQSSSRSTSFCGAGLLELAACAAGALNSACAIVFNGAPAVIVSVAARTNSTVA